MTVDFKDFDAREAYEPLSKRARSASARNFVLDFSHARARCAFDIDESDLQSISSVEVHRTNNPVTVVHSLIKNLETGGVHHEMDVGYNVHRHIAAIANAYLVAISGVPIGRQRSLTYEYNSVNVIFAY